jgi:YVTN family beta-propeller protein
MHCSRALKENAVKPSRLFLRALAMAGASMLLLAPAKAALQGPMGAERMIVGNRDSGDLSIIDTQLDVVVATIALPANPVLAEPMYITHAPTHQRLYVGDRRNDVVVVLDDTDFSVVGLVPVGDGLFHMWNDPAGTLLWVNNELDGTATLIDPGTLAVIATVPMPADLVNAGWGPHDVVLTPSGDRAYVSLVRPTGPVDWVVSFDTATLVELGRARVGKDPHLALQHAKQLLFVPTLSDGLTVLDPTLLTPIAYVVLPGSHGAALSNSGAFFYSTNPQGGAVPSIYTVDTNLPKYISEPVHTPLPVPHNLALTSDDLKLYVTHSGTSGDTVSVYDLSRINGRPTLRTLIPAGSNPFGILRVP